MFFYKLLNFFYNDRILGQAGRKIGESVGSISRGPTPDCPSLVSSPPPLFTPFPVAIERLYYIRISNIGLENSINYRNMDIGSRPKLSDYRISDTQKTIGCPPDFTTECN
jgi:hypothetical protein